MMILDNDILRKDKINDKILSYIDFDKIKEWKAN